MQQHYNWRMQEFEAGIIHQESKDCALGAEGSYLTVSS